MCKNHNKFANNPLFYSNLAAPYQNMYLFFINTYIFQIILLLQNTILFWVLDCLFFSRTINNLGVAEFPQKQMFNNCSGRFQIIRLHYL